VDRALPCGSSESPLVSVLIPHFNLGNYLPATLASVRGQTYPNVEIVIVDDYSTELSSRDAVEELRRETSERFRVITAPANLGPASARNLGITAVQGKYVLPLDADDLLDPRFIEIAVEALERNPEFSVVVTQAAYFKHGEPIRRHGEERDHNNYDIFIGESLVGGYLMNRFSTVTALFRTEVLRLNPYCDGLSCEDWDLYFRLVQRGYRFLVTTGVYFLYRDRAASRVKSARRDPKAYVTQGHSMLRTAVDVNRILPLTLLAHSAKLAQIYTSVSWRVTAPVRRAKSWLLRG
jgi:glycosyltransferase involved in cell wall biosynthesis